MRSIDCGGQRTALWFEKHLGKLTSSRIAAAITKRKRRTSKDSIPTEPLQAELDLRLELAVERVTQKASEHFVTYWMERGAELEPLARAAYEVQAGKNIELVDFVLHPEMEWAACSPDGICGDELIEIKVPKPETHAQYLLDECVPEEYLAQMHWQLACCPECKANTFISYCPNFARTGQELFICRLNRDNQAISVMEAQATVFLKETADLTLRLTHGLEGMLRASLVPKAVIPAWDGETSEDMSCA